MSKSLVEMAADIVKAQCTSSSMTSEEVAGSLQSTFQVLQSLQSSEVSAEPLAELNAPEVSAPTISPEKSIQKNRVICLECGQSFKQLSSRHLASHGLDGREYRKKYNFPMRQPLCAKSLTEQRKKAGKERGVPANLKKYQTEQKQAKAVKKAKKG